MTSLCPSKFVDVWHVYQDWTIEDVPRCFYCGKGDDDRIARRYRNKHHKNVALKYGMKRIIVMSTHDEQFALDEEIKNIAEQHTYVYDPQYNGIGTNYTIGGEGTSGHKDTPEQRDRRRISQTLAWRDPVVRLARIKARNRPDVNEALKARARITQSANWKDDDYRATQCVAIRVAQNNPQTQAKRRASNSIAAQEQWCSNREMMLSILQSDAYREKQRLAHVGKKQRCGLCGELGHKRSSCKKGR